MANIPCLYPPSQHTLTHAWECSLMQSVTGVKQRSSVQSWPKVYIKNSYILDTAKYSHIMRNAWNSYAEIWEVPLWTDETDLDGAVLIGDEEITVTDASNRYFYEGGKLVILGDYDDYEILEIAGVSGNDIALSSGEPSNNWPDGTKVYPIIECELARETPIAPLFVPQRKHYDLKLIFEESFRSERTAVYSVASGADTYQSIDILLIPPTNINHSIISTPQRLSSPGGFTTIDTDNAYTLLNMELDFIRPTRAEIWKLLNFFDGQEGGLKKFWVPSFMRDIEITEDIDSADTVITINDIDYSNMWLSNDVVGKYIIIFNPDLANYICREIVDAPSATTLELDSAVGEDITVDSDPIISFLHLGHFSRNYINLDYSYYYKHIARSSVSIQSVVGEAVS